MMTLSKQRKFTNNSLLEDIRGSQCCVIKVRQYRIGGQSFQPILFNQYLSNVKCLFVDNSRAEPTTFSTEKISFSLKLLWAILH